MNCKGLYLQLHVLHILKTELGTGPGPVGSVPFSRRPAQPPQMGNLCPFWKDNEGPPLSNHVSPLSFSLEGHSPMKDPQSVFNPKTQKLRLFDK